MYKLSFYILLAILLPSKVAAQLSADFSVNNTPAKYCAGEKVVFTSHSSNQTFLKWDFGDSNTTYFENPEHIFSNAGTFTVLLTVYDADGNSDSFSKSILILEMPNLTLSPNGEQDINFGQSINAQVTGTFTSLSWNDENNEQNRSITQAGKYIVTAYNSDGCSISDSLTVSISTANGQLPENFEIRVINNILTPNGDGYNDFLFIEKLDQYQYPCRTEIYNAYGQQVFLSTDYKNNWGGEQNGKPLPAGTYYYITTSEKRKGGTGYIDILR